MNIRFLCLLCLFIPFCSLSDPLASLQKNGEGTMTVMFWDVYRAQLYSPEQPYQLTSRPQALSIVYLRDIKKTDLVEATKDQWQKIGFTHPHIPQWLILLEDIWPNVNKNSQLVLRVDTLTSTFYHNDEVIGTLDDPDFGPAFISIWLSENTTRPELRKQLLGLK